MFQEGQQIGPYTLIHRLGRGGFGDVWLAERRSQFLRKRVAVKLPHDDQVDFNTIQREAGLWEEASGHPNVLPIIDAEVYEDQVVIVSEYADGGSLADKLKDVGTTTVKEAVDLTIGILNGLEFLHEKRIIHRDIKPQNILLQGNTPRLADFGISRAMATSGISSTVIGTDAYMSPEAFDGKRTVQTDIWSTGVVLYELLNGTLPFPQAHPTERMFAVLTKDFEPLDEGIPGDLRQIVTTALAKLPENRFRSAAAMREALGHAKVRIDHPTFASTEVFDRSSMPVIAPQFSDAPTEADHDATVIRVQIPIEQETFVRPVTPEHFTPASTVLAIPEQTPISKPFPAPLLNKSAKAADSAKFNGSFNRTIAIPALAVGGLFFLLAIYTASLLPVVFGIGALIAGGYLWTRKLEADSSLGGIVGIAALIVGSIFLIMTIYAMIPSGRPQIEITPLINVNTAAGNGSNAMENTINSKAATPPANEDPLSSNSTNIKVPSDPASANTDSNKTQHQIIDSNATFCEGYELGWKDTFTTKGLTPPSTPSCPDPAKYRKQDAFGGQIAGTLDAMKRIYPQK